MKRIITSLALVLVLSGAVLAQNTPTTTKPTTTAPTTTTPVQTAPTTAPVTAPPENPNAGDFKFLGDETYDFGNIPQNKPVTHDFQFTNIGKEPIVISEAHASCGCTVPKWPKDPILPGKTDVIQVTYNAAHAGGFNKSITITSNAKTAAKVIFIKGNVEAAPVDPTTTPAPTTAPGSTPTPNTTVPPKTTGTTPK